jgi:hypothetical protein
MKGSLNDLVIWMTISIGKIFSDFFNSIFIFPSKKTEKNLSNAFYKEKPILFFSTKNNGVNDEPTETYFLTADFLL